MPGLSLRTFRQIFSQHPCLPTQHTVFKAFITGQPLAMGLLPTWEFLLNQGSNNGDHRKLRANRPQTLRLVVP